MRGRAASLKGGQGVKGEKGFPGGGAHCGLRLPRSLAPSAALRAGAVVREAHLFPRPSRTGGCTGEKAVAYPVTPGTLVGKSGPLAGLRHEPTRANNGGENAYEMVAGMRVLKQVSEFGRIQAGCVLTIGNFDGVHVGHQEILRTARRIARDRGREVVVMTFEPHPVAVLYPEKAPGVLTPLPLKLHLLQEYADECLVLEDSRDLLHLSPADFVDQFLLAALRPGVLVEGADFHFGAGRAGDTRMLVDFGRAKGFEVVVVESKQVEFATGQVLRVSSTIIRYMLEGGHVAEALLALSRPYRLMGPVVSGWGRGRKLGFPTLNMSRPDQIIPAEGVYAGYVETAPTGPELLEKHEPLPAVFSIGPARTFGDEHPLLIEAHVLGGDIGDMTGRWMAMDFVQWLRRQHKFASPQELVAQIAKDCQAARQALDSTGRP
jgi:riboflavin kinase/FMN adenylyltransferase